MVSFWFLFVFICGRMKIWFLFGFNVDTFRYALKSNKGCGFIVVQIGFLFCVWMVTSETNLVLTFLCM